MDWFAQRGICAVVVLGGLMVVFSIGDSVWATKREKGATMCLHG